MFALSTKPFKSLTFQICTGNGEENTKTADNESNSKL